MREYPSRALAERAIRHAEHKSSGPTGHTAHRFQDVLPLFPGPS